MSVLPSELKIPLEDHGAFALQLSDRRAIPRTKSKASVVTRWSIEQFQLINFSMTTAPTFGAVPPPQIRRIFGASVSFDHHTLETEERLTREEQAAALLDGLEGIAEAETSLGLNVEGFQGAGKTH